MSEFWLNDGRQLAWLMERQSVKTDAASGLVSDANRNANENIGCQPIR